MPRTRPRTSSPLERRLVRRIARDPVWFADEVLGAFLWSKQREIAWSVRDNRRTAVRACHGPGKTYVAAVLALWFLHLPRSRVVTTAPTWRQIEKLLWHEIRQQHGHARYPIGGHLTLTALEFADGRYAIGLSVAPGEEEAFMGHHAENILVIYDEASGVRQPVYEAGEGYMTTPGARALLIGNPTRPAGEFYDAFHSKRDTYATIAISAFDLPWATGEKVPAKLAAALTSEEWVEEHRYWQGSPLWDVKVLGQFPAAAEDAVIALAHLEPAQERELPPAEPRLVACDVARYGTDETVIAVRRGPWLRLTRAYVGRDLMQTVGAVIEELRELGDGARVVVDDVGVGGGVTDRLREQGVEVEAFNGAEQARDPERYPNRRSEAWFTLAERLPTLDLDPDRQLAADLASPRYRLDSRGRRTLERKEDTKKRLGRSPDRGDAIVMLLAARPPEREVVYQI